MRILSTRGGTALVGGVALMLVILGAASAAVVTPPASIKDAGKLAFCTDPTYPPEESLHGSTPVGSDIDIGRAVAHSMGVTATFRNVGFDGIIAALLVKKCDAIISGMTDNAQRRHQVSFADYLDVGMSLMVRHGNPRHVTGLASLSGLSVAAQVGTVEKDALTAENDMLAKQHRKPIAIRLFNKDTDAAAALLTGKVDAYFADDPPVGYYVKRAGDKVEVAASKIQSAPIGIATRKGDALGQAMRKAIASLYANGTMKSLLAKWGLSGFALR
jgi:polar amino acid transport system substrate-binding protein